MIDCKTLDSDIKNYKDLRSKNEVDNNKLVAIYTNLQNMENDIKRSGCLKKIANRSDNDLNKYKLMNASTTDIITGQYQVIIYKMLSLILTMVLIFLMK